METITLILSRKSVRHSATAQLTRRAHSSEVEVDIVPAFTLINFRFSPWFLGKRLSITKLLLCDSRTSNVLLLQKKVNRSRWFCPYFTHSLWGEFCSKFFVYFPTLYWIHGKFFCLFFFCFYLPSCLCYIVLSYFKQFIEESNWRIIYHMNL